MGHGKRKGRMGPIASAFGKWPSIGTGDCEDYEVEADDGADLVEFIRACRHFGRDAFLETDVDFYG